jgi:hypothetical protein
MLLMTTATSYAQCTTGPSDCLLTPQQALTRYSAVKTVGTDIASDAQNVKIINDTVLYVPSGITFTGSISDIDATSALCIDQGGEFVGTYSNINGVIYNFNTTTSLNLFSDFKGSLENYGGVINVKTGTVLEHNRYILNCEGTINWESSLTLNSSTSAIYNGGLLTIGGQLSGQGCIHNEAWLKVLEYNGQNNITNNGKIEILSTKLWFNQEGVVINNCALFSSAVGSDFQNNASVINNGLIYLPYGTLENKASRIFRNGQTGVVRTQNLHNEGIVTGAGKFYVQNLSENVNGNAIFGYAGDAINFYDASPGAGGFDIQQNIVGSDVFFDAFPMPEYSPDLSEYQCGEIILASSVNSGAIAASQVLCQGIDPEPFISIADASVPGGGAFITYQWQSSTDSVNFYNIDGAIFNIYSAERPITKTFYRRRAKAEYPGADSIKNAMNSSNIVSLTPLDNPPPVFTVQPANTTVCANGSALFTASAQYSDYYQWQVLTPGEQVQWADIENNQTYTGVNSQTLTINGLNHQMNGYQYRLAAIQNICGTVYSNPAELQIFDDVEPEFIRQVADSYVCNESNQAYFSIQAVNETDIPQWQISTNEGLTWNDITDDEAYRGFANDSLQILEPGIINNNMFRCILISQNGCFQTISDTAALYVVDPVVEITPFETEKCPDTDTSLGFSSYNHDFQLGKSTVMYSISCLTEHDLEWSFHYSISADPDLLDTSIPLQGDVLVEAGDKSYAMTFLLLNQNSDEVEVTFEIIDVRVDGCLQSSNENHSSKVVIKRMPTVGEFDF